MKKKTLIWLIVCVSILFNILFFVVDIFPVLSEMVSKKIRTTQTTTSDGYVLESHILDAAMKMAGSTKHIMPYEEQTHFIGEVKKILKEKPESPYRWFDHPKGLLFVGLTQYALNKGDTLLMQNISKFFDRLLINYDEDIYKEFRVDQIPFGLAAINLHTLLGEEKYKKTADKIFEKVVSLLVNENDGLIYYRINQADKLFIVDTLGMACPFLLHYGNTFNNPYAIQLAYDQLQFYSEHGLDKHSFLPAHAVLREGNIKVGSQNWGRGIGWYFYPLAEYSKYVEEEPFSDIISGIINNMEILKMEGEIWAQFPGTSDRFDASTTLMYMYAKNLMFSDTYNKQEVFSILSPFLYKGIVGPTSGGAFSINTHSRTFGDSELSMGFLMMLLSIIKD